MFEKSWLNAVLAVAGFALESDRGTLTRFWVHRLLPEFSDLGRGGSWCAVRVRGTGAAFKEHSRSVSTGAPAV